MKCIIAGMSGFLGKNLKEELDKTNIDYIGLYGKSDCDFMDYNKTRSLFKRLNYDGNIDVLVNCASAVGGIGLNMNHPASLMYKNTILGFNLVTACINAGIRRIIQIGTVCSYPKIPNLVDSNGGFLEGSLWNSKPDHSNSGYGISKLALMEYLECCKREYNINYTVLMMSNMYGHFDDYSDESSHVIPALVKRIVKAKEENLEELECWGTGEATRDLLWCSDGSKAVVQAIKNTNIPGIMNIGTGKETKVSELVYKLCSYIGYTGRVKWLLDKPDGQPRRVLNIDKAKTYLNWYPEVDLDTGLKLTIDWYLKNKDNL